MDHKEKVFLLSDVRALKSARAIFINNIAGFIPQNPFCNHTINQHIQHMITFSLHMAGSWPRKGRMGIPGFTSAPGAEGRGLMATPPVSENTTHHNHYLLTQRPNQKWPWNTLVRKSVLIGVYSFHGGLETVT